jgi:hypothetical protein
VTAEARPGSLRAGLRRLASGLIAYGAIGLLIALIAAIALVWAGGRLISVGARVESQIVEVIDTLERTSTALRDASATATSFSVTLERTPPVVRQTAQAIADLRADLRSVQSQFAQVEVLGRRPLGTVADGFGRMAGNLDGLDTRLELIATDLESNRSALLANATSLGALGDRLGTVASDLEASAVAEGLGDLGSSLTVLALVMLVWITIPAAGALWLGWWLRGEVGLEDDERPSTD